jgi:hypothetical protein
MIYPLPAKCALIIVEFSTIFFSMSIFVKTDLYHFISISNRHENRLFYALRERTCLSIRNNSGKKTSKKGLDMAKGTACSTKFSYHIQALIINKSDEVLREYAGGPAFKRREILGGLEGISVLGEGSKYSRPEWQLRAS